MQHRLLTKGLALAAGLLLAASTITPATAGPETPNRGRYAALGDSYAAGVGNTPLRGSGDSGRSSEAYPVLLAGAANKVTFLAESGATTVDVLMEQVPMVPEGARQITLTVGGNDVGFASIALACAAGAAQCQAAIGGASWAVPAMQANLGALIMALQAKAPGATIYVTGYPQLFQPDLSVADSCPGLPGFDPMLLAAADLAVANPDPLAPGLNEVIKAVAESNDAVYADVTDEFSSGLCSGNLIYPPTPISPTEFAPASLHPTALGQQAYAAAIMAAGFDS